MTAAETITAWDNISRDFSWMTNLDPRVIQGLLTFLSAATAALVALHIARKIYPIQKDKDRDIKIDEEKRVVYRDFLKNIDGMLNQRLLDTQAAKLKMIAKVKASLNEVSVFANKETAEAMLLLYLSVATLSNTLSDEADSSEINDETHSENRKVANFAFKLAVNAARKELGVEPLDDVVELAILTTRQKLE